MKNTIRVSLGCALGLALLGSDATSQATTIHPVKALSGGNSSNNIPFGYRPLRYQQILDWSGFSAQGSIVIKKMRFRMTSDFAGKYGGQRVRLSLRLGLTPTAISAANPSRTFADNLDATTVKTVVSPRWITLPKIVGKGFDFVIPFDSGQTYPYRAAAKRNLCFDLVNHGNSVGNKSFTYPIDAHQGLPRGQVTNNGSFAGCRNALRNSVPTQYASTSGLYVGSPKQRTYGYCGKAGVPCVMLLGARPIALRIGSCELRNDVAMLMTRLSSGSTGYAGFDMPIPNEPGLKGVSFLTQLWWFEAGATATGLYATKGLRQTIANVDPYIVATRAYAIDPAATKVAATHVGYGLVVAFEG